MSKFNMQIIRGDVIRRC